MSVHPGRKLEVDAKVVMSVCAGRNRSCFDYAREGKSPFVWSGRFVKRRGHWLIAPPEVALSGPYAIGDLETTIDAVRISGVF